MIVFCGGVLETAVNTVYLDFSKAKKKKTLIISLEMRE